MLYQLVEVQKLALVPLRMAAQFYSQILKNPFNPVSESPQAQTMAAGLDLFSETTQYHGKPAFGITSTEIDGQTVLVREEILKPLTFCQLKHFKRATQRKDPKLLIVAPMSGHFATLLRGTVETMIQNHDVYITDWRDAANVPLFEGRFDLDDYIDYIQKYLEFLGPDTHVMAVCQPGVPVLAAVALMAEEKNPNAPLSVTLMGSPIDTRRHPTEPCKLAMEHSIETFERMVISPVPVGYPGAFRRVYPGFLQLGGFVSMNLDRHLEAHMNQFDNLVAGDGDVADKHRAFYAEYNAVMDLTAEFYLQTIETVFQKQSLAKGEMMYRGDHLVKPELITKTALMTVEGELDDISGIGQTVAAQDLCSGLAETMKTHYEQKGVGHYGVFNGRRFNSEIAPRISDFIRAHEPKKAATQTTVTPVAKKAETAAPAAKTKTAKADAPKTAAPTAKAKTPAPKAVTPKPVTSKAAKSKTAKSKMAAPKTGTAKAETPKAETPKVGVPKAAAPKAEAPKVEVPKVDAQKAEAPKAETPKAAAPKAETPKVAAPKVEAPKVEAPKSDAPSPATPAAQPKSATSASLTAKKAPAKTIARRKSAPKKSVPTRKKG
ncbi:polyhydroxyalkanoate depolymerase [Sneathiella sp.]|uniref:polyhydroxyalkanoate depolymerase n=1 Tax=Sneathiella sp. TaxID=1964365 RepID=UPI003562EDC4